ncbi:MAG: hypothetical protein WAT43_18310 [Chitinophagales bacterium]
MKNIQIALVTLLIFVGSNLHAQSKKYKTEGRKCTRVEIITPGGLFSNYELSDGDVEMMKIDGIKDFLIEKIKKNGSEKGWPVKLASFEMRMANPDALKKYVVYKVIQLDDKVILVAPAKYNQDLEAGWSLTKDIYFVMYANAVH